MLSGDENLHHSITALLTIATKENLNVLQKSILLLAHICVSSLMRRCCNFRQPLNQLMRQATRLTAIHFLLNIKDKTTQSHIEILCRSSCYSIQLASQSSNIPFPIFEKTLKMYMGANIVQKCLQISFLEVTHILNKTKEAEDVENMNADD